MTRRCVGMPERNEREQLSTRGGDRTERNEVDASVPRERRRIQCRAMSQLSPPMAVEVERKFVCDADIQRTLQGIGAVCIGQRQFHDRYFDTPDFDLTLKDVWLRQREGCWELKCPTNACGAEETGGGTPKGASLCTRYKEITDLFEIKVKVREAAPRVSCRGQGAPGAPQGSPSEGDGSWLRELNLVCFAEFTTVRCSFSLAEEGVQIDLDQADFGYSVGEIEVLIPEGEDMGSAVEKIEKTARKLNLTGNQPVQGKMTVYLKLHCPDHYAKLLKAHVINE